MESDMVELSGRTVVLADDHAAVRRGVGLLLSGVFGLKVIEAVDAVTAVAAVDEHEPDLALFDVRLGRPDGLWALREVRDRHPSLPVLMLSTYASTEYVRAAIEAGADGYVLKEASTDELGEALRAALAGRGPWLHPGVSRVLFDHDGEPQSRDERLSERERTVLRHLSDGCSRLEVSVKMSVGQPAVDRYINSIVRKLNARSIEDVL